MNFIGFAAEILIVLFVLVPICTFLHELGHAIMALALTDCRWATVRLGRRGPKLETDVGRLVINLHLGPDSAFGIFRFDCLEPVSQNRRFWIILGGPLMSLLVGGVSLGVGLMVDWSGPWAAFAAIGIIQFLITAIPWHYATRMGIMGRLPSDGLRALRLIQETRLAT
jgi:hypothetical protein